MATEAAEVVTDEIKLLAGLVPLRGALVVDVGCGNGDFARRLVGEGQAKHVDAFEVDAVQHARNLAGPTNERIRFGASGAQDLPLPDGSRDLIVMMKSLHHVPVKLLDQALAEAGRVLRSGGHLYVSEPVFAGDFNEVVRLFHDEAEVRAAAHAAVKRACSGGMFTEVLERQFMAPIAFRDYGDFFERIVKATHSEHVLTEATERTVRERFEAHMSASGARFIRPMRINLLRTPQ